MSGAEKEDGGSKIFSPIGLPCGRELPNRLVKVAMYEHLAKLFGGPPNSDHFALYTLWAKHNWGMIITGNVQVSPKHLSLGRDMVIPKFNTEEALRPFQKLARAIKGGGNSPAEPLAIMQLSHAGRQSPNILGGRAPFERPLAPSAIALGSGKCGGNIISDIFYWLLFQTPKKMSVQNIDDVVDSFVRGTNLAYLSGFDGVQLHAAHGYLISQFMSHKTNHRLDEYSCNPDNALRLLQRIVTSIRAVVPGNFVVGIKINSDDYVKSSLKTEIGLVTQERRALEHIQEMVNWNSLDFIEISGGDYENPDFMSQSALDSSPRQALFSRFSCFAKETIGSSAVANKPLVLLTGGLRSPSHLNRALQNGHADLLGIGRGAVACPDLPEILSICEMTNGAGENALSTRPFAREPDFASEHNSRSRIDRLIKSLMSRIQLVGTGATMAWYVLMIRRLVQSNGDDNMAPRMDYAIGALEAVLGMWIPIHWRWTQWKIWTIATVLGILATCIWSWTML